MASAAGRQVRRQTLACLLLAQAVVIAPLFLYLPLWLGLVWLLSVVIRVQVHRGVWRYPGNITKVLMALLTVGGLVWQYGLSVGVEPMVGLLLSAFMLKLVEARQRRDLLLIIFIGFVAVGGQFLFSQTIFAFLYGAVSCIALLIAWHSCFVTRELRVRDYLSQSARLLAQAAPLMLLLFLVLPRLGPLWAVPPVKTTGSTGFGDSMAPGDIAELSLSSQVAFRVTFDGEPPHESQMYWRGLVLDQFDGREWTSSESAFAWPGVNYQGKEAALFWDLDRSGETLTYEVMLEPHQEYWLFALETALDIESDMRTVYTSNHAIKSRWPVTNRVQYRASSDLFAARTPTALTPELQQQNLQLPASPANPRTRQLVASWEGLSPAEVISRALGHYQSSFSYTLRPPPLGTHSIDEFLFITQKGFCEHFAGSFVYLMRSAGIPARVVLGYQGAERSEVDDYWLVRQSHAHAWAEVWLPGQGWLRVDPTAAVAPGRVEMGLQEAVGADEVYLAGGSLLGAQNWSWLRHVQHRWDAVGYAWHRRVLGFDQEAQKNLFERFLGGSDPWRIALVVAGGGGAFIGLFALLSWLRRRGPALALEHRLLAMAERRLGVPRDACETPTHWAERVAAAYPQRAQAARQVARLFEAAVYAGRLEGMMRLEQAVKALPKNPQGQSQQNQPLH